MGIFPLTLRVQYAPGADLTADPATWVWTDITSHLRAGISITRGRGDESGTAQPSTCSLTLKAADGQWLPYNRTSPRWPGWRRGVPLRVQVSRSGVWHTRYTGFVDDIAPRLASDRAVDTFEVDVTASGVLRRLGQGVAVRSPLYRVLAGTGDAYLPLESGVTAAQSGQPNGSASGVSFGSPDDGLPGSAGVARMDDAGALMRMPVPVVDRITLTQASTVAVYVTSPSLVAEADLLTVFFSGTTLSRAVIRASSTLLRVTLYDSDNTSLATTSVAWTADSNITTSWVGVSLSIIDGSPFHTFALRHHAPGSTTTASSTAAFSGGSGQIVAVIANAAGVAGTGYAHMWVSNASSTAPATASAAAGWSGEDAGARVERLCAEHDVPVVPVGDTHTAMGPQTAADLMALLREVEATDGGLLYEALDGRLAYLPRVGRYNRAVALPLTYGQLSSPLAPTDDDRHTRNDVTASRPGGTSARYSDEEHVDEHGRYESTVTVSLPNDNRLLYHAAWRVHLGTVEALRLPQVTLNLGGPAEGAVDAWLACDVGSRTTVDGMPEQLATERVDQQIEGYAEILDRYAWTVTLNASPSAPWQVAVAEGTQRVPARGSTLNASLSATAMTLSLTSTAANGVWTTNPVNFPLALRVGGERVTATAISGTSSPQTVTLSARGVNGVQQAWPAGTDVDVWDPAVIPL